MRHRFNPQPDLDLIPIEKVRLPLRSRDELPPILAGLQWIWTQPNLKAQIFVLLEQKILAGKKATGRTGLDLWQILVLGVVRLGLDAKRFNHQTLRDNLALLDDALLQQINALVAAAGRDVFKKKETAPAEPLAIKVDTYVLETDVHFPTDLHPVR